MVQTKKLQRQKTERGFFALITVTILGLVFLFAVLSLAQQGIMGRFMLLDAENKFKSEGLAEACVQSARVATVNDPQRTLTNLSVKIDSETCTILSLAPNTPSAGSSRVRAKGVASGATTNIEAIIDSDTGEVTSWKELYSL